MSSRPAHSTSDPVPGDSQDEHGADREQLPRRAREQDREQSEDREERDEETPSRTIRGELALEHPRSRTARQIEEDRPDARQDRERRERAAGGEDAGYRGVADHGPVRDLPLLVHGGEEARNDAHLPEGEDHPRRAE